MQKNLTRNDIIARMNEELGFSKREAKDLLELLLETMSEAIEEGNPLTLQRFGRFKLLDKKARPGRNPATGQKVIVSARRVVVFVSSKIWRSN
jgi:integration host factor subunit alpha